MTASVNPSPDGDIDGSYAWFRLAISILLSTLGGAGMWAVVVVLPAVQQEFALARGDASLPYTLTMIGFGLGNLLIGRWVDRFGIVLPMIASALALGCGFLLAALSTGLWSFALAQGVLIGFGTGATFGPLLADVSHWFKKRRGIAVAAAASGNYLAGAVWPSFIKFALAYTDWRMTYILMAAIIVTAMVPLTLFLRRPPPHTESALSGSAGPATDAPFSSASLSPGKLQLLLVIAGIGCCVAMAMPQVHIVAYCVDLGFGVARGAEMLALMVGAGIVSRLISGWLADHIGAVKTVLLGSILQCAALFLFLPFDGLVSLYIVSLIFGLAQGGIVPSYALIVREFLPAKEAGERVGLVMMATIIGMALGGWMSGAIYDLTGSYDAAFLNGIAWNLVNMAVLTFILMRSRPRAVAA